MHVRQAKYKASAEMLLENQFDEYLKKHVINVKPVEQVNCTLNRDRFLRMQERDPKQRRINTTLNLVEDIVAKEKICYGY